MKKFQIGAQFLGLLFTEVEAETAEEAKEKFLTALGTEPNDFGDPSVTIENVLVPGKEIFNLKELNMAFPEKLTDADMKYWDGIEVEEVEE